MNGTLSGTRSAPRSKAEEMRAELDRAFAAPREEASPVTTLLAIRVDGEAYALRLSELAGVAADRRIIPFPSDAPSCIGIAGHHGDLVPVFALGSLLGRPRATTDPRWLGLVRIDGTLAALAFDEIESCFQVAETALSTESGSSFISHVLSGSAAPSGGRRAVLSVPALVDAVWRSRGNGEGKEA
jgi:chemotaxis signal transduction protein